MSPLVVNKIARFIICERCDKSPPKQFFYFISNTLSNTIVSPTRVFTAQTPTQFSRATKNKNYIELLLACQKCSTNSPIRSLLINIHFEVDVTLTANIVTTFCRDHLCTRMQQLDKIKNACDCGKARENRPSPIFVVAKMSNTQPSSFDVTNRMLA